MSDLLTQVTNKESAEEEYFIWHRNPVRELERCVDAHLDVIYHTTRGSEFNYFIEYQG